MNYVIETNKQRQTVREFGTYDETLSKVTSIDGLPHRRIGHESIHHPRQMEVIECNTTNTHSIRISWRHRKEQAWMTREPWLQSNAVQPRGIKNIAMSARTFPRLEGSIEQCPRYGIMNPNPLVWTWKQLRALLRALKLSWYH